MRDVSLRIFLAALSGLRTIRHFVLHRFSKKPDATKGNILHIMVDFQLTDPTLGFVFVFENAQSVHSATDAQDHHPEREEQQPIGVCPACARAVIPSGRGVVARAAQAPHARPPGTRRPTGKEPPGALPPLHS